MPYKFDFKQKSLQRRFLFILGFVTFLACFVLGLMIMFWGELVNRLNMPTGERLMLGSLLLIYSLIRFLRFFKKAPDEEE
jgi:hypothetical protein